jgi:hypothetical protein
MKYQRFSLALTFGALLSATAALLFAGCAGTAQRFDAGLDPVVGGRKLYVAKCAKCHKLYDPAKYSDEEWAMWMRKMSKKARLNPEQEQLISRYIATTPSRPAH